MKQARKTPAEKAIPTFTQSLIPLFAIAARINGDETIPGSLDLRQARRVTASTGSPRDLTSFPA